MRRVAHRILMIDDDKEMVTLGKLILEREGFEVLSAYSGMEGLQVLDKEDVNIDLILLINFVSHQILVEIKGNAFRFQYYSC